jgi:hypothetical protein
MKNFGESSREEEEQNNIPPTETEPQSAELLTEAGAEHGLEMQSETIATAEKKHNPGAKSALRKWIGAAMIIGASLVAIGCNAEKPSVGNPEAQKVESTKNGFTDNHQEHVKQSVKMARDQFKHMKEMKGYYPNKEAKDSAKDMRETQIVQPIDDGSSNFNNQ